MTSYSVELSNLSKTFIGKRPVDGVAAVHNINLGIHAGEFFTLLGPSGCGKTTTLRMIGGFEVPTKGEIYINGKPMSKVPPYKRPVNIVFQNYALFPHLTVTENVGFGLEIKKVERSEREKRVHEMLELVRLPDIGDRMPGQLSGGQQQRIALARALINEPSVLLLDEPLGALDLKLRKQMQFELKDLQQRVGITFIYVTHDQEEALTMSDRIAVLSDGETLQVADPVTIYERPATRFVAEFIGESNFISGKVVAITGTNVKVMVGNENVYAESSNVILSKGQQVILTVRPEKLNLVKPEEANGIALSGTVQETLFLGTDTRFIVRLVSGECIVARLQNIGGKGLGEFSPGEQVKVTWASQDVHAIAE